MCTAQYACFVYSFLHLYLSELKVTAERSTTNQVRQMVALLASPPDASTALKAAENLVVLARDESGAAALGDHLPALVARVCALALHERPLPADEALLATAATTPKRTQRQLAAADAQLALALVRCIACFGRHNKQRVRRAMSVAFNAFSTAQHNTWGSDERLAHTCPALR